MLLRFFSQFLKQGMEGTQDRYNEMVDTCGKEYIDTMIQVLKHWVEAGKSDHLSWGILHMNKSTAEQTA
jgi:hypothetical protein